MKGRQDRLPGVKGNVYIWQNLLWWHVLTNHTRARVCAANQRARRAEGAQGKQSRPGPGTANIQLKCRAGFVVESESGDGVIILN